MDCYADISNFSMDAITTFTMEDIARTLGPDFDPEHLVAGLDIVLDYLNDGNEYEKLLVLQARANLWTLEYFNIREVHPQRADAVLAHHPRLFNLSVPSLLRLDPGSEINPVVDAEDDDTKHPFPAYCEPVLIDDAFLNRILELADEQLEEADPAAHHDATTTGGCFSVRLRAVDLCGSPIALYLPCVVANIATLDLTPLDEMPSDDGTDDGFLSSSISSANTASTASSEKPSVAVAAAPSEKPSVVVAVPTPEKPQATPSRFRLPDFASSLSKLAFGSYSQSWGDKPSLVIPATLDYMTESEDEKEKEGVVEYTDDETSVEGEVAYSTDEPITPSEELEFRMELENNVVSSRRY